MRVPAGLGLSLILFHGTEAAAEPARFSWPQMQWEAQIEAGADGDCAVRALAVDGRDAVVVAGYATQSAGPGTRAVPLLAKFGASGRRLWVKNALGRRASPWGEVRLMAVHESREITAYGPVGESLDDPFLVSVFARFAPDGTIRWTRTLTVPGVFRFEPAAMAGVAGGGLVVAGTGRRPEAPEEPLWCVVRLDAGLAVRWVRTHISRATGEQEPGSVVADSAGNAFILGRGRMGDGPERWLVEGWGPGGERRMSAWGDGDASCVSQTARRIAIYGRWFVVAGDQVCQRRDSSVFVRKLDREGRTAWSVAAPTPGRAAAVCVLPSGGTILVGEETAVDEASGVTWPFAMRWNAAGDLMMACRGLRKDETTARYAAAALDSEGNLVVAGESTVPMKGVPVRRIFLRKMAF